MFIIFLEQMLYIHVKMKIPFFIKKNSFFLLFLSFFEKFHIVFVKKNA